MWRAPNPWVGAVRGGGSSKVDIVDISEVDIETWYLDPTGRQRPLLVVELAANDYPFS
jgi:hypothetical protein